MNKCFTILVGLTALATSGATAQDCTANATIGNFDVSFEGATFDGHSTQFGYCFTGVGAPEFRALSNWVLALDPACILPSDITQCGSGSCYFQANDPNLGLTGIKFDDVEVEYGETQCFSFSLRGDWTDTLQDVSLGLKAGQSTEIGAICGPTCAGPCGVRLSVNTESAPTVVLELLHRRPPTFVGRTRYALFDQNRNQIVSWAGEEFSLAQGDRYLSETPIPNGSGLEPGRYSLHLKLSGMSGWRTLRTSFEIAN